MDGDLKSVINKHHGGCPHDCPDTCAMVFHVQDKKLIKVQGNPDHPMTRGGLCVKLNDYEKRHYHPDRLLYPMKRVGPKGEKQFERITWDEALIPLSVNGHKLLMSMVLRPLCPIVI